jgi:hypothetical protein
MDTRIPVPGLDKSAIQRFIIGQYAANGDYQERPAPQEVYEIGDELKDAAGQVIGVKDNGDWISATLKRIGVISRLELKKERKKPAPKKRTAKRRRQKKAVAKKAAANA